MTPTMMALFITATIFVNVLMYGGIYATYMGEKSGYFERPAKGSAIPAVSPFALAHEAHVEPAELDRAA